MLKIHQDGGGVVATATSRSKAVSFGVGEKQPTRHNNGRKALTPLRSKKRKSVNSPYPNNKNDSSTLFKSPSSKTTTTTTSNSFRQGLKKGCTPSSIKSKIRNNDRRGEENDTITDTTATTSTQSLQNRSQQQQQPKQLPKTPNSASALRRVLRGTSIQSEEMQQQHNHPSEQIGISRMNIDPVVDSQKLTLVNASRLRSSSGNNQQSLLSRSTVTASTSSSLVAGRSRLIGKGGVAATGRSSMMSCLGPPKRVEPKTPNSLLRTELEDEDDDFDESLLMSPPPGALWNALNISSGAGADGNNRHNNSPMVTTGLIIVSPQAAEQIHTWSSTKKKLSSSPLSAHTSSSKTNNSTSTTSPTVPRALMQTPHAVEKLIATTNSPSNISKVEQATTIVEEAIHTTEKGSHCAVDEYSNEDKVGKNLSASPSSQTSHEGAGIDDDNCKSDHVIEKTTRGGIAMALTDLFSPNSNGNNSQQQQNQQEKTKIFTESTPLSSSIPAALLSRLTANKQKSSSRQTQKKETRILSSIPKASLNSSKNRKDKKTTAQDKTKSSNKITTKPSRNNKATDMPKPWKTSKTNKYGASNNLVKQSPIEEKLRVTDVKRGTAFTESIFDQREPRGGLAFDVGFNDVATEKSMTPLPSSRNKTLTATTNPSKTTITKESNQNDVWAERQCESFVGWLNYTFNPEEMDIINEGSDIAGLRALLIHRRLAASRAKAFDLFRDDSMHQIRTIIVKEIARGKLSIRSDRDVTADIQLRKKLVSLLLSYTTPWLRMGLEVMFGECIEPVPISQKSPKTYLGRMKLSLEIFMKKRFLSDDFTLEKFTKGRCNVPSGIFETRYKAQMRNLVLSRIMTLVFFLDRAKTANVLDKIPRLFTVSSEVKSSRDVLVTICRECLSSEGDVVKHLSRIGLKISYVQDPVDEVSFKISNLATDLRDGVLLTRLAEIITAASFKTLMSSLRLPVVSRLQKKFNVNLALSKIKDSGITIAAGINAHHIMDGHREKVLVLMWCIIAHCCMEKLLQGNQVEEEIQNVARSSQARKKIEGVSCTELKHASVQQKNCAASKDSSPDNILKDLLLRWSQAVCSSFGLVISDLSDSFANGKALCLLIHYYHPSLIRVDDILPTSLESDSSHGDLNLNATLFSENERANWKKASKATQELGGIPDMIPICDSRNPPDEKSMLLCLSYLCSRLMESSQEIFATILIQACYRKYRRKIIMEKKIAAAAFIFRIWTQNKDNYFRKQKQRYTVAVATLEDFILSHKYALKQMKRTRLKKEHMMHSAINIQRVFRGKLGRDRHSKMLEQENAVILIQSIFRQQLAIRSLNNKIALENAAVTIQCAFRRYAAREVFLDYRFYIIQLQGTVRGYLVRKEMKGREYAASLIQQAWWSYVLHTETELAATYLQKTWRGILGRRTYIECSNRRNAACSIQKIWRGYYQSLMYFIAVESSVVLQKMTRGFLSRKVNSIRIYHQSTTSIQKIWRGFSVQVQYQVDLLDICSVQSLARRYIARRVYSKRVNALSVLQCAYRCSLARRKVTVKIEAIIEETHYRLLTSSATKIQSAYRVKKLRSVFVRSKKAVVDIQKYWRGYKSRRTHETQSFAATMIQSIWRQFWVYSDYKMFLKEKEAAVLIQAYARRMVTRRMIDVQSSSARMIQRQWHRHSLFTLETYYVTMIQAVLRSYWARTHYRKLKKAAIVVQKIARVRHARKVFAVVQNKRQCEDAAISIQRIWRGFSKQVQFQMEIFDIICVQSVSRRFLASRAYQRSISAASTIQRASRCSAARRERSLRKLVLDTIVINSVITLQTIFRSHTMRSKFSTMKYASVVIQRCWQGHATRKCLGKLRRCATSIQSSWRMYQLRSSYFLLLESATKIQSCCRLYSTRSRYLALKDAVIVVQRCSRGFAARDSLIKQSRAATMIQSNWRRTFAQNNYLLDLLEMRSATIVQASFRMYMRRMDYMVIKFAAQTIQKYTRGLLSRVDLAVKHFAASEIQRIWRGYCTYSFKTIRRSAIKVQSVMRMVSAKKKVDELKILYWAEKCYRNRNAVIIQTSYRKYVQRRRRNTAAIAIQGTFRFYSQLKRIQRASRGIIALQSSFRATRIRHKRSKKVAQVARRIQEETRRAVQNPTMQLGWRTSRALEILQTSQSLTKIMDAVKELEASTRLSVVCCQVFTSVNAADILLHLIQSCNRSVPHMELKEHILLTLENVAQYPSLVGSFAHYKYAGVFLDNIQVFRDKEGIFCLAVLLLDRIAKANQTDVPQFCAKYENLKRLKEVVRVVGNTRSRSRNETEKSKRLRRYGLAKRNDYNREKATRILKVMISNFTKIEIPRPSTPKCVKQFTFD